jgi:hypothetical protein
VSIPAPPGSLPCVGFPHQDEFARKFFLEVVRHLGDARVLHRAGRYPGSITSSQKAAELAIKAVLMLEGTLGWWDRLQQTHRPLEEAQHHPVLTHHVQELRNHSSTLIAGITALEKLAPSKPDVREFRVETQANTEYPFFYLLKPGGGPVTSHLDGPSEYFTDTESLEHYRTAHELLTAYQSLHAQVRMWKHRLPRPL